MMGTAGIVAAGGGRQASTAETPKLSDASSPWGLDGPPGATGVLLGGVPPVKGVWGAAPGSPPQAPIFWGFFD